jgi:uncharacterized protein
VDIRFTNSISEIDPAAWNALVETGNVFMTHEFLSALELSRCTGATNTWRPQFVTAYNGDQLVGALPSYIRSDSYGEYIFDWAWANAYEQGGLLYYPKITVAAPFTPASGRRILTGETMIPAIGSAMTKALEEDAMRAGISGIHILCLTREEQKLLSEDGYHPRLTHQYHWINRDFHTFDDYLAGLRAHRRKEIKRERRKCEENNLEIITLTGDGILPEHMEAMYKFYVQTYARKWGSPYLNLDAFHRMRATMREQIVLVMAHDSGTWVAGSIAFRKDDRLFGRYWGAVAHFPFLHFELCFYRLIDYAIAHDLRLFEAGAQGEHKFQRGFTAMPIYSAHRLFHPQGAHAIGQFLDRERRATIRALKAYRNASPNKAEPEYLPEAAE